MRVAIIFGGVSTEHTISVATGVSVYESAKKRHDCFWVYVDKNGVWKMGKNNEKPTVSAFRKAKETYVKPACGCFFVGKKKVKVDCALLCLHGKNGEDGVIASALQIAGIPYSGSGVLASGVGLDKDVMKKVFIGSSLPVLPYFALKKGNYVFEKESAFLRSKIGFPLIIKPSKSGSSIGIGIAKNESELKEKIDEAFEYDDTVIVEKALQDFTEVNCAVLKCKEEYTVSCIEQPRRSGEILGFDDKYSLSHVKTREIPARIGKKLSAKVKALALSAFKAIGADGVARIDFLIDDDKVYVNEINTIPGSLSFYLFSPLSISAEDVCDKLIEGAIYNKEQREKYKTDSENKVFIGK